MLGSIGWRAKPNVEKNLQEWAVKVFFKNYKYSHFFAKSLCFLNNAKKVRVDELY